MFKALYLSISSFAGNLFLGLCSFSFFIAIYVMPVFVAIFSHYFLIYMFPRPFSCPLLPPWFIVGTLSIISDHHFFVVIFFSITSVQFQCRRLSDTVIWSGSLLHFVFVVPSSRMFNCHHALMASTLLISNYWLFRSREGLSYRMDLRTTWLFRWKMKIFSFVWVFTNGSKFHEISKESRNDIYVDLMVDS